jgi:signal transduction histidine kinase
VVAQLVQNAIRYRQEGVDFRLTVQAEKDGSFVFLILEDNGQGFEIEHHRPQLFGLFKTFHPAIKGRGLGLYMVKMMLDSMGACIDIDSKPGKGTKIMIQLPAA